MQKSLLYLVCSMLLPVCMFAQRTQVIKGKIVDKESKAPLIGVALSVSDLGTQFGAVSGADGSFIISNVPVGKHTVTAQYLGYQSINVNDVLLTSAKEVFLPLEMEESVVKMNEATVTVKREHINDMALISTKTFDVQETERYAGSRGDPARMASNFAGVQGGDDSRNDIIVRGNSPQGVLWRLEGVDIPNPNHFAIAGTTGGPVSILNNKTLANSDFYTGAFPAEYGDAVAGVFDLNLRNGNKDRHEFTGQFGFLGTELATEGPINKKKGSSYLFSYRYSTLQLFRSLNIKIGTTSVPKYQDATFKLNFPISSKANFSIFAIGGLSKIDLIVSDLTAPSPQLYGESDRDQYFKSNTGILGANYSYTINSSTFVKLTIAETGTDMAAHHDYVFRDANFQVDSLKNILGTEFITTSTVAHLSLNKKYSAKSSLKLGLIENHYHLNLTDSSRQYPVSRQDWQHREDYKGSTSLMQAYAQFKYRPSDQLTFTGGLHAQYLSHNGSKSLEPRLGMKWFINNTSAFTLGYGLHSQMMPLYVYFQHLPQYPASVMQNYNVDFTRSHHFVVGYDKSLSTTTRFRLEAYYQYLFNVPVETRIGSSYSGLDQGSGYSRDFPDTLKNGGTGYNYGLELTLEKGFSKGFYVLFTGSVFDSKAKGNDGVYRNTDYNSHYAFNILGGYEKKIGKNNTLITGIKITYAGGKLYSPADITASNAMSDLVVVDSQRNTLQFKDYFRADIKLGYRINSKKVTHEFGLDLVNLLGTKNVLSNTYSSELALKGDPNPFYTQYQLGFLPIFYYRLDFGLKTK